MTSLFLTLIDIPYLTTGRRLFAFKQSLGIAQEHEQAPIIAMIEEAIAHDRRTLTMERAWMRSRKMPNGRGNALQFSRQIEKLLTHILTRLKGNVETLDILDPTVDASRLIMGQIYPTGVAEVTNLPFEDQLANIDAIIERFNSDLKDAAELADVTRLINRLILLAASFRDELEKPRDKEIDYDVLTAARKEGNINLRKVVCVILTHLRDDEAMAAAVIKPIFYQVERVQQWRKNRHQPSDVDPDTGQELEPPSQDADDTPSDTPSLTESSV